MTELDKIITANLVFSHTIAEALISKGILTKDDLQNALTILNYESPIPPLVFSDVQKHIDGLPGDSSSTGTQR